MIPGRKYTPEVLLALVWWRKWFVLLPAAAVACGVAIWAHRLPDVYQSQVLIQVVPPRIPESYVRANITTKIEDRLNTISQQIMSRTRLEQIIQDLNLYPESRKTQIMEDVVNRMRQQIAVRIVKGNTFSVTYSGGNPRMVMQTTERLASLFIDQSLRDREVLAEGTSEFLEAQLEDARRRLIDTEQKLGEYRRRYDGELPKQLDSNTTGLRTTESQIQSLVDSINRDRDRRLFLERQIADTGITDSTLDPIGPAGGSKGSSDSQKAGPAAEQLRVAQEGLRGLELRLKPGHPDVIRARRTIAELQKRAEAEAAERPVSAPPTPPNPAEGLRRNRQNEQKAELEKLDRDIAYKLNEEQRLRDRVAEYQRRIEASPKREAEMTELSRDYDTLQSLYRGLLSKKEDSQIAANLERRQIGEQFKIIDPAQLPVSPVSPDRVRLDLIGVVVGLLFGLLIVASLEYLDRTLRSEQDITGSLNLPVLVTIPLLGHSQVVRRRWEMAMSAVGVAALVAAAAVAWKVLR